MVKDILEQIKDYCKGKNIIIVGNSSLILKTKHGKFIDSHDIVVRMNGACPINPLYYKSIGKRTDIYCVSYQSTSKSKYMLDKIKSVFGLRLNPDSHFQYESCYFSNNLEYSLLKSKFNGYKPSTGSMVLNFFKNHIDYKSLNIIGFDFFESFTSSNKRNEFGSFLYKDHSAKEELAFVNSCIDYKTEIIK